MSVTLSDNLSPTDWFSGWFNSPYYHILYKHRDYREAEFFIKKIADFLNFQPRHKILDLACGRGRHSVYLNKMGLNVVGLDLSPENIAYAKQYENEKLHFHVHDMREVFEECCYDFVLNLFTSFGYFPSDEEDLKVIHSATVNLKSEGRFIIDFLNPKQVIAQMVPYEQKEIDGILFHIHKSLEDGFIVKTIRFEDQGQAYTFQERVKAIPYNQFRSYFEQSKLDLIHTFGSYHLESFNAETSERMIFVLEKR